MGTELENIQNKVFYDRFEMPLVAGGLLLLFCLFVVLLCPTTGPSDIINVTYL